MQFTTGWSRWPWDAGNGGKKPTETEMKAEEKTSLHLQRFRIFFFFLKKITFADQNVIFIKSQKIL